MDFGILLGDVPTAVSEADHFDSILRQVEAAQRAGMNHILIGQHFMFERSRWFQPVPVLARLAAEVDPHVRLVTQILIAPLYHPVLLAEELATLDVVTGGRLTVGMGIGYIPSEYEVLGVPFAERGSRLEETVVILQQMWTQDRVSHVGRHFTLEDVAVHVRPLQRPHPPIWIGAGSPAGVARAARLGASWPITPQVPPGDLAGQLTGFFEARERAGLPPRGRQPLRREIMLGADRESALARAVEVATPWYLNMAATGHNKYVDPEGLVRSIPGVLSTHWVLGSPEECAAQLRALGSTVPVDPVITRANWPGMTTDESVRYIEQLGTELIPLLADFQPVDEVAAGAVPEPSST
jgi:alkanesulfonate monooxygenase SsuD/methylene tetrahydromethanopterin reductase-like flavin-dependent oxidoreductase (luciferase family)